MKNAKKKATAIVLTAGLLFTSGMVLAETDMGQQFKDWVASGLGGREQAIKDDYYDNAVVETGKLIGEVETVKQEGAIAIEEKSREEKEAAIRTLSDLVAKYKSQLTTATTEELANMNAVFNEFIASNKVSIDEVVKILGDGNKTLADQQLVAKQEELVDDVTVEIGEHQSTVSTQLQGQIDDSKSQVLTSMDEEQRTAIETINEYLVTEFDVAVTDIKEHIEGKSEEVKTALENVAEEKQQEAVGAIDELIQNAFAVGNNN